MRREMMQARRQSRPVWGAWIEIPVRWPVLYDAQSRPVWGAWIEMHDRPYQFTPHVRRAPYGARGLKYWSKHPSGHCSESRPVWGAWIEILLFLGLDMGEGGRAPYGARGLKFSESHGVTSDSSVAPRMGRVD